MAAEIRVVYEEEVRTLAWDWGTIRMLCDGETTGARALSFGIVASGPGAGHELHCHADAEEVIHIISGEAELLTDVAPPLLLRPGATIFVPAGCMHATRTLAATTLRAAIVYAPAGPERHLRAIPGCLVLPPARAPRRTAP